MFYKQDRRRSNKFVWLSWRNCEIIQIVRFLETHTREQYNIVPRHIFLNQVNEIVNFHKKIYFYEWRINQIYNIYIGWL